MILYPSQLAVLLSLSSADNFRTSCPENSKLFDDFVIAFFNHKNFQHQTQFLVEKELIDEKGNITSKGRTFACVNPQHLSKKELSIRTNQFLFESLKKGTLSSSLQHVSEDTFLEIATIVNNEMEARYPEQMAEYNSKEVATFQELVVALEDQTAVEDEILNLQSPSEVVVNNQLLNEREYEQSIETKVKKSKKVKA